MQCAADVLPCTHCQALHQRQEALFHPSLQLVYQPMLKTLVARCVHKCWAAGQHKPARTQPQRRGPRSKERSRPVKGPGAKTQDKAFVPPLSQATQRNKEGKLETLQETEGTLALAHCLCIQLKKLEALIDLSAHPLLVRLQLVAGQRHQLHPALGKVVLVLARSAQLAGAHLQTGGEAERKFSTFMWFGRRPACWCTPAARRRERESASHLKHTHNYSNTKVQAGRGSGVRGRGRRDLCTGPGRTRGPGPWTNLEKVRQPGSCII